MAGSIINAMMSGPNAMMSGAQRANVKANTLATQIASQMQQQQEQQRARAADLDFHQHLTDLGAMPGDAQSGLIKEQVQTPATSDSGVPGQPGLQTTAPPSSFQILRKMDPSRTVRFKDSDGTPVAYELPTPQEQVRRQVANQQPVRAAAVQQEQDLGQAWATGAAAGRTQGSIADRTARGTPVTPAESQMFHIPVGALLTPEERNQLSERYFTVDRTNAQQTGATDRTNIREMGADERNAARIQSQSDLLQSKNDFLDEQNRRKLGYQNAWAQARNTIASNTQGSLNNRVLLRQFDTNQQLHGRLLDSAYKESQKQLEAGALLDPKGGVENGAPFTDPWSGKQMTMNVAQRLRIGNALKSSQQQIGNLQDRASQIEQRFGLQPVDTMAAPAGTPGGGGAAAPGATRAPAGAPAKPQAKIATQDQVQAYAKKKGVTVDQALQEFKSAKYAVTGAPSAPASPRSPLLPVQ